MAEIPFVDFILGGLADSEYYGPKNSLAEIVGFDLHSQPGKAIVNQKLTKDSGTTVDELCKVGVPLSDGSTVWFSSTSGKVWRENGGAWTLLGTLSFPGWDLRTAAYMSKSKDVSAQVTQVEQFQWKPDGLSFYISDFLNSNLIYQYTCSTAWDIATATYASKQYNVSAQTGANAGGGFFIRADGVKLFVTSKTGRVYRYTLGTAWDISTATYDTHTYNASAQDASDMCRIMMKSDGLKMILSGRTSDAVYEYTLGTAWDLTTISYVTSFSISGQSDFHQGMFVNDAGTKMFILGNSTDTVHQYSLATPWSLASATYDSITYNPNPEVTVGGIGSGLGFRPDGLGFVIVGTSNPETIYQFSLTAEDLNATVLGAEEHDGNLVFATKNKVSTIPVATITDLVLDRALLGSFTVGDDTYHPMKRLNGILYIGDGNLVAQVEAGVFTPDALDIVDPLRISALGAYDVELLIGTIISANVMKCDMIRWNTWSDSWQYADPIPENGVNAFLDTDNEVVVSAGSRGHIYTYDGYRLTSKKRLPSTFTRGTTNQCRVNPYAVMNYEGVALFGMSQVSGNAIKYGVYSYARRSAGYPFIFALEYVISQNVLVDLEIGAIVSVTNGFLVSWKNGSSYGVDRLDTTAKYGSPYMRTRLIMKDRRERVELGQCDVAYASLPESTDIIIKRSLDGGAFAEVESVKDAKRLVKSTKVDIGECIKAQIEISCTVSGNNAPEIEGFYVDDKS